MLIVNVRCKRCGGNLYIERNIEGDTLKCLACGFERDIPVEVKPVPVITQNEWEAPVKEESITQEVIKNMKKVVLVSDEELEKQKEAIVADYMNPAITLAQTLVKWHIQSTRWHDLKIKWNVPGKRRHGYKRKQVETKPVKEHIEPKYRCPYCGLWFSQVEALIQHATVCQSQPFRGHDTKLVLPPWNEAWGDSVKIKWLEVVSCIKS